MGTGKRQAPLDRYVAAGLVAATALGVATTGLVLGDLVTMSSRAAGLAIMGVSAAAGVTLMAVTLRILGRAWLSVWLLLPLAPFAAMVLLAQRGL